MKHLLIIRQFSIVLLITLGITACQKEPFPNHSANTDIPLSNDGLLTADASNSTQGTQLPIKPTEDACSFCTNNTTTYDLRPEQTAFSFKEGNNLVKSFSNGTKAIAVVKDGKITGWQLQEKNGNRTGPRSVEKRNLPTRPDDPKIYKLCYVLDEQPLCWFVIGY